ncbi:MAG: YraN family protein [Chakrabartia sp.]
MKRQDAEKRGLWGERRAAWWLRLHGWRIIAMRAKVHIGEVDIIARRGRTTAFVEVKTRATASELDRAIDRNRLRRVAAATNALAARYAKPGDDIRIDVILIAPKCWPRHLINVWHG